MEKPEVPAWPLSRVQQQPYNRWYNINTELYLIAGIQFWICHRLRRITFCRDVAFEATPYTRRLLTIEAGRRCDMESVFRWSVPIFSISLAIRHSPDPDLTAD